MRKYSQMFDLETFCVIRDYRKKALLSDVNDYEFNPRPFLQRFALNTTLTLCYGIRMDNAYDELLREILNTSLQRYAADGRCRKRHLLTTQCIGEFSGLYSGTKSITFMKYD